MPDGGSGSGAAPALAALGISPLDLVPPFSPSVHDYYVRCPAGGGELDVTLKASNGATASLFRPVSSAAAPVQTVHVKVLENEAVAARVTDGAVAKDYWVRCLPADFVPIQMTKHPENGVATPGYYLVGNQLAHVSAAAGYAIVLDANGVPVWYVRQKADSGVAGVDTVIPNAISFFPDPPMPDAIEFHALSPLKTTYLNPPHFSRHEFLPLPNGHFLALTFYFHAGIDLTGMKVDEPGKGTVTLGANETIGDQLIQELDLKGNVHWQWKSTDHLDPARESTLPAAVAQPDGSWVIDTFHFNSIDLDPNNGNLLVSIRNMDAIIYIERSTGRVLWKMGGTNYSKDGPVYVPVDDPYYRQHDARFQPGWSSCHGGKGRISLFDDQSLTGHPARAAVYEVTAGAEDGQTTACGAAEPPGAHLVWEYVGQAASTYTGSFRILPDGSRVIDWGYGGVPKLVFTEIDACGNDLLDFYFLDGNSSYRTIKLPLDAFDIGMLRETAGRPY